jgi:O-antigen ligase
MLNLFERLGFQKEKLILTVSCALIVCLFAQITSDIWLVNDLSKAIIKYSLLLLSVSIFALETKWFQELSNKEGISFLLLFLAYAILACFWSGLENSFSVYSRSILYVIIYIHAIIYVYSQTRFFHDLILLSSVIITASAFISLLNQYCFLKRSLSYRGFRIYSSGIANYADFGNPNYAAFFYGCFAVFLCGYLCVYSHKAQKTILLAGGTSVLLLYVILTYSRITCLAVVTSILLICLTTRNWKTYSILTIGTFLICMTVPLCFDKIEFELFDRGFSGRLNIWQNIISQIADRPFFGKGTGHPYSFYVVAPPAVTYVATQAHNWFLQALYNYGLVGLSLFVLFIWQLLKNGLKNLERANVKIYFAMSVYALILMVTDVESIFETVAWSFFWLPISLLLAATMSTNKIEVMAD